ncbi:MAG: ArsB/NhaD family transporter [Cellulosilyticum sp.]|nr:ArsB/NhaD family transporter [Cellulosilyticum sp.]
MTSSAWIAIIIFIIVLLCIITEVINRTLAAMAGAMAMVFLGIIDSEAVASYIDFNTIGVLIGMMLLVSTVKKSGLFEFLAIYTAKLAKGGTGKILIGFSIITAVLSAILDNVTTVLLIGPMTLVITQILQINPVPFLISEILASNIGGTSTLIGDPPNIMIGSAAGLGFSDFVINLFPVIVVILSITLLILYFLFRKSLAVDSSKKDAIMALDPLKSITDYPLLYKSLAVIFLVLIGFIFHDKIGVSSSIVALTGATIILIIGKQNVEEIFHSVEWLTIGFFCALFVIVGGLEEVGIISLLATYLMDATAGNPTLMVIVILWLAAIVSSFLDNIPFVATLIPLIITMGQNGIDITPLWWAISLGACLGGNGTLIGASANLVLANIGTRNGHKISFGYYFKYGFPLMLISIVISMIYLLLFYV